MDRAISPLSESQQIHTRDPRPTEQPGQTQLLQGARNISERMPSIAEPEPGQPRSTLAPLSPPGLNEQLTIVAHLNPLRGTRMGEQQPLHPPPQVVHRPPVSTQVCLSFFISALTPTLGDYTVRPIRYLTSATHLLRKPAAPRGRWNSVSQSVEPKGKVKRRAEKQVRRVRSASPEPRGPGHLMIVDTHTTNTSTSTPIHPRHCSSA